MGQFTQNGVIYEELPDGNVRVVGYEQANNVVAPSPARVAEKQREQARQDAADARADRAENKPPAGYVWTPQGGLAPIPGGPADKGPEKGKAMPDGVAKRYEDAINAFASLERATSGFQDDFAGNTLTGELENKFQNLIGTGTPGQAQWWADFASTDNILRNALFGASLTQGEKAAYEATSIKPNMAPAQVRANLTRRMELARETLSRRTDFLKANGYDPDAVDALAGEYGQQLATQKADNEIGGQANGAPPKAGTDPVDPGSLPPANAPGAPAMAIATGPTRTVGNDRLSAQVDAMMNAGASKAMIDTVLKKQGFPAIDPSTYAAARTWMQQNPGKKYFGANITREEDQSLLSRAAGSAIGSGVAQYADAATGGLVGALAGDKGRGALDAMGQTNPNATAIGSVLGGITGAAGAEAAIASRAPAALSRFAPRIADAIYGGTLGFNKAKDGEGLQGAALGAGLGVLGGVVGEGAMRAGGAALRGVTNPAVQRLRDAGVPMTVGQVLSGSGAIGRGVKKVEDALTSLPGVGNMIDARRLEGLRDFNRAAFEVGSETTENQVQDIGAAGINALRQNVGDSYDNALGGVRIDAADPQFGQDMASVLASAQRIPNVNGAQDAAVMGLRSRVDGAIDPMTNEMTGRGFQEAYRGLARTGRERANGDYGHEIGLAMREGQDALAGALERQNPGAYQGFLDANQANRRLNVLADAVGRAKNAEDNIFTPAQLNMADEAAATRLTGKVNASSGNRPFAQLAQDGQAVLPSKLPDSGTATRALIGAGATGLLGGGGAAVGGTEGAATGTGVGLGATLGLMLGGSRAAQSAATRFLLERPDVAVRLGRQLGENAGIGGWTGAGALTPLLVGP